MNRIFYAIGFLLLSHSIQAQDLSAVEHNRVKLSNGWSITPIGKSLPLGDVPLNIAVSKTRRYVAVTNNGQSKQSIQLFDAKTDTELDKVEIGKSWGGIVFSADEKSLYVSGGDDNWIIRYAIENNKLIGRDTIRLGKAWDKGQTNPTVISLAGIALDDKRGILYVVTKLDNSLYVVDVKKKTVQRKLSLGSEAYTCLLSTDLSKLYISLWGGDKVVVYDTRKNQIVDSVKVGNNPNDLCISHKGKYLYVANANDNTVSVVELPGLKIVETLNTAVHPTDLSGTTSNSVALSDDDKTLYIANADNNCLAVFNVSTPGSSHSLGFVPTGWFPSSVRVSGSKLYVANAKGFSSFPNPHGPNPVSGKEVVILHGGDTSVTRSSQYIGGGLIMGTMSIIPVPTEKELAIYSQAVYHNTPYNRNQEVNDASETGNPIPSKVGDPSSIKYVFYVIKENRSYDQVLGDMPQGNGDTSLVLFGRHVTPNQHSLVDNFVLLDNFYVDGEVSADGHNWSMGAYATDWMEKNWPTSYGGRGPGAAARENAPVGLNKVYIWDQASRFNITFRSYGEFVNGSAPRIPVLKGHFPPAYNKPKTDLGRYEAWEKDFDSLLNRDALPRFMTVKMPQDHTSGTKAGALTPYACVAENDLAVGKLVEHVSKSRIWENTVIFILEDDAQNGPDHVDAHRSPVYLAGGYVKRGGQVDHTMYSTSSVLRTIELILGMPPMTQYDAAATPMWRSFNKTPDNTPFKSLPANINLHETNPSGTKLAALAKGLDFSDVDRVPDEIMNTMLWKAIKGEDAVVPSPVHAAFVKAVQHTDEDDDDK